MHEVQISPRRQKLALESLYLCAQDSPEFFSNYPADFVFFEICNKIPGSTVAKFASTQLIGVVKLCCAADARRRAGTLPMSKWEACRIQDSYGEVSRRKVRLVCEETKLSNEEFWTLIQAAYPHCDVRNSILGLYWRDLAAVFRAATVYSADRAREEREELRIMREAV